MSATTNSSGLTERQQREKEYYEEFVRLHATQEVDLRPARGDFDRPANSYWHAMKLVRQHFTGPDNKLLDFGCGSGMASVQYATIGYQVFGFDIASGNIENARKLTAKYGVDQRSDFRVGVAECLDFPDGFFDVVSGIDILHHVDIPKAIAECKRVLKPGGIAVFHEPVIVPLFDSLRDSSLGRKLVSKEASLETHITEDERKLTAEDLITIRGLGDYEEHRFFIVGRLSRLVDSAFFEKVDAVLLQIPGLASLGGRVVMRVIKR